MYMSRFIAEDESEIAFTSPKKERGHVFETQLDYRLSKPSREERRFNLTLFPWSPSAAANTITMRVFVENKRAAPITCHRQRSSGNQRLNDPNRSRLL